MPAPVFASRLAGRCPRAICAAAAALLIAGCQEESHRYSLDPAIVSARATKSAVRPADTRAPQVNQALMKAPREPSCEEKTSSSEQDASTAPVKLASADQKTAVQIPTQSDPNKELATRIRLEYDRECYKQAERRVRAQLEKLQAELRGKPVTASR